MFSGKVVEPVEGLPRERAFLLLRYTLILATAYLLLVEGRFSLSPPAIPLMIAAALASNLLLTLTGTPVSSSPPVAAGILLCDTLWITVALLVSGRFTPDFFCLYFFVLLLAAMAEDLRLIALGALAASGANLYLLTVASPGLSLWQSPSLIRTPFLFTAALFYGYLVDQTRNERARSYAALQTSEERFRAVSTLTAGYAYACRIEADGTVVLEWATEALERITGFSLREIEARGGAFTLLYPDDLPVAYERFEHILSGEQDIGEIRIVTKTGDVRWTRQHGCPVWDDRRQRVIRMYGAIQDITESKQAAETLRQSEERFSSAFKYAAIGMALVGLDGNFLRVNQALCDLTGHSAEELTAKTFQDITHPDDLAADLEYVRKLLAGEIRNYHMEKRYFHKRGHVLWILLSVSLVRDAQGQPLHFIAQIQDITERKRAEQALSEREEDIRRLIEESPVAMLVSSGTDQRVLIINRKFTELFGYTIDDIPDVAHWWPVAYPDEQYREEIKSRWSVKAEKADRDRGEIEPMEARVACQDGSIRHIEFRRSSIGARHLVTFVDLTERKQAEEREKLALAALQLLDGPGNVRSLTGKLLRLIRRALDFDAAAIRLRQGEDFLYLAHDGFPEAFVRAANSLLACNCDGVITRDADGRATLECTCGLVVSGRTNPSQPFFTEGGTFWTNDSSALLELPPEADPRRSLCNQCIHSGYMSVALIPLRHGEQIMGLLQLNDREKGRFTPGLVHFLEGLGASIGIALSGRQAEEEISRLNADLERRVRERTAQLEATNKELEAFSYSVSHDLRAPLRAVDGFSAILLDRYGPQFDAQGHHYLQRVREGVQRMDQLINDLLVLSRITRSEMHWQVVDLSALARTVAGELQKTQPARQAEFVVADDLVVEGDPGLLRAALENLLSNSWKYTSKHPTARIEFGVSQQDGQPVYFVRDDGAGFDMAYVGKLFGAFQRLHATDEFEGTGIGLATVQRVIRRHGGRVWAEGGVEQGATFYFTLPEAAVHHEDSDAAGSDQLLLFY